MLHNEVKTQQTTVAAEIKLLAVETKASNPFLTLPKKINNLAILDVDDTVLTGSNSEIINTELLDSLKAREINDIFLFTSMSTDDPKNKANCLTHGIKESISRDELISILKNKYGFNVHGVITNIDDVYRKGLGAAYNDMIHPHYRKDLKPNVDINFRLDAIKYEILSLKGEIGAHYIKHDIATYWGSHAKSVEKVKHNLDEIDTKDFNQEQKNTVLNLKYELEKLSNISKETSHEDMLPSWFETIHDKGMPFSCWDKGGMYAYFLQQLKQNNVEVSNVIYFDDKINCLNSARYVTEKMNATPRLTPILTAFQNNKKSDDKPHYYEMMLSDLTIARSQYFLSQYQYSLKSTSNKDIRAAGRSIYETLMIMQYEGLNHNLCKEWADTVHNAITSPNEKNINTLSTLGARISGKRNSEKKYKLLGGLMIFLGTSLAVIGALALAGTLGLATPVSAALLAIGGTFMVSGYGLFRRNPFGTKENIQRTYDLQRDCNALFPLLQKIKLQESKATITEQKLTK